VSKCRFSPVKVKQNTQSSECGLQKFMWPETVEVHVVAFFLQVRCLNGRRIHISTGEKYAIGEQKGKCCGFKATESFKSSVIP